MEKIEREKAGSSAPVSETSSPGTPKIRICLPIGTLIMKQMCTLKEKDFRSSSPALEATNSQKDAEERKTRSGSMEKNERQTAGSSAPVSETSSPGILKIRTRLSTGALIRNGMCTLKKKDFRSSSPALEATKSQKETPASGSKRKASATPSTSDSPPSVPPKRRKMGRNDGSGEGNQNDYFCWLCHKDEDRVHCCELCPRVYHLKCQGVTTVPKEWVCPECEKTMRAECADTISRSMSMITIDTLCLLLQYALDRMRQPGSEAFEKPVDLAALPTYSDYVFYPMDFTTLEQNIKKKEYGCTEAFLADAKWILHNCIVFKGPHHKLTNVARNIIKSCKHEMSEIEVCPECYQNSCIKGDASWFLDSCHPPHTLVWAKLKRYPFWPAKALQEANGQIDVQFFGTHNRSKVPMSQVFLLSNESPVPVRSNKGGLDGAMAELKQHIKNIREQFGTFVYPPHHTGYDKRHIYMNIKPQGGNVSSGAKSFKPLVIQAPEASDSSPSPDDSARKNRESSVPLMSQICQVLVTDVIQEKIAKIKQLEEGEEDWMEVDEGAGTVVKREKIEGEQSESRSEGGEKVTELLRKDAQSVDCESRKETAERENDGGVVDNEGLAHMKGAENVSRREDDDDSGVNTFTGIQLGTLLHAVASSEAPSCVKDSKQKAAAKLTEAAAAVSRKVHSGITDSKQKTLVKVTDKPTSPICSKVLQSEKQLKQADISSIQTEVTDTQKGDGKEDAPCVKKSGTSSDRVPLEIDSAIDKAENSRPSRSLSVGPSSEAKNLDSRKLSPYKGFDYRDALTKMIEACKGKLGLTSMDDIGEDDILITSDGESDTEMNNDSKLNEADEEGLEKERPALKADSETSVASAQKDSEDMSGSERPTEILPVAGSAKVLETRQSVIRYKPLESVQMSSSADADTLGSPSKTDESGKLSESSSDRLDEAENVGPIGRSSLQTDVTDTQKGDGKEDAPCVEKSCTSSHRVPVGPAFSASSSLGASKGSSSTPPGIGASANRVTRSPLSSAGGDMISEPDSGLNKPVPDSDELVLEPAASEASGQSPDAESPAAKEASPEVSKLSDVVQTATKEGCEAHLPSKAASKSASDSVVVRKTSALVHGAEGTVELSKSMSESSVLAGNHSDGKSDPVVSDSSSNLSASNAGKAGADTVIETSGKSSCSDASTPIAIDIDIDNENVRLSDKHINDNEPDLLMEVETEGEHDQLIIDLEEDDLDLRESASSARGSEGQRSKSNGFVKELSPSASVVRTLQRPQNVEKESDGGSFPNVNVALASASSAVSSVSVSLPSLTVPLLSSLRLTKPGKFQSLKIPVVPPETSEQTPESPSQKSPAITSAVTDTSQLSAPDSRLSEGEATVSRSGEGEVTLTPATVKLVNKYGSEFQQKLAELCREVITLAEPEPDKSRTYQQEMEKMKWIHQQEVAEIKHNFKLAIAEMKAAWDAEKSKCVVDLKKRLAKEKDDAVLATKRKQWCASCLKEAIYYCCWNTSYCSYQCQQQHWPTHLPSCTQAQTTTSASTTTTTTCTPTTATQPPKIAASTGATESDVMVMSVSRGQADAKVAMEKDERFRAQKFNIPPPAAGDSVWRNRMPLPQQTMGHNLHFMPLSASQPPPPPQSQPLQQLQYLQSLGSGSPLFQPNSQMQLLTPRPGLNTMLPQGSVMPPNATVFPLIRHSQGAPNPGAQNIMITRPYQIWK